MENVFDFIRSVLPWVAIGLFVGIFLSMKNVQKKGKAASGIMRLLMWSPLVCFLLVSILEFMDGDTSSGTTWLVIGLVNAALAAAGSKSKSEEEPKE